MYHCTPAGGATSVWDVPMSTLKDQVRRLKDNGVEFIPFAEAMEPRHYDGPTRVCMTFDDGHESNLRAFDFLAGEGVPSTAFIIRDFSRDGTHGIISANTITAYADRCDFGGHGTTHTDLTTKAPTALSDELAASRAYLEDATQRPVLTMSAPGGRIDSRVVSEARRHGYKVIGNSVDLTNLTPRPALNRLSVLSHHDADYPSLMAGKSAAFWWRRRARRSVGRTVVNALGENGFNAIRDRLRGLR